MVNLIRRQFFTLLGGAAAWPLAAAGQQPTPVVGFLNIRRPGDSPHLVSAFFNGLAETAHVNGQNVKIEYRWGHGQVDQLPSLAQELVSQGVAVIFASGNVTAMAAKGATESIPIVFISSIDPVELGFVASLNRPGGNMTGVSQMTTGLAAKQLEILHQVVPHARNFAVLVNPTNQNAEPLLREARMAADVLQFEIQPLKASSERDLETAFTSLVQNHSDALLISEDAFFTSRSAQLAALTLRHSIPGMFVYREFATAGGLITYGTSIVEAYRQCGVYVGKILSGANPKELPVQQPTKFEMVINVATGKALGVPIPATLIAVADEVIE
jgi:putative ABC transport system substrate-binding protein